MATLSGQLGLMKQILQTRRARLVDLQKSTSSAPSSILRAGSVLVDRGLLKVRREESGLRKVYIITSKGERALRVITEISDMFDDSPFEHARQPSGADRESSMERNRTSGNYSKEWVG